MSGTLKAEGKLLCIIMTTTLVGYFTLRADFIDEAAKHIMSYSFLMILLTDKLFISRLFMSSLLLERSLWLYFVAVQSSFFIDPKQRISQYQPRTNYKFDAMS